MQDRGLSAWFGNDCSSMMPAHVVETTKHVIIATHHNNWLASDGKCHKLARSFDLFGTANHLPAFAEYGLLFQFCNPGIDIPGSRNRECIRKGSSIVVARENLANGGHIDS